MGNDSDYYLRGIEIMKNERTDTDSILCMKINMVDGTSFFTEDDPMGLINDFKDNKMVEISGIDGYPKFINTNQVVSFYDVILPSHKSQRDD